MAFMKCEVMHADRESASARWSTDRRVETIDARMYSFLDPGLRSAEHRPFRGF